MAVVDVSTVFRSREYVKDFGRVYFQQIKTVSLRSDAPASRVKVGDLVVPKTSRILAECGIDSVIAI